MTIITHGKPAVLAKLQQRFVCPRCECEFIADWRECDEWQAGTTCDCPDCGMICRVEVRYD